MKTELKITELKIKINKIIKKITLGTTKFIQRLTPRGDYLAHDFWGNHFWSNIGVISAMCISYYFCSYWLVLLPLLTTAVPAATKEFMDGKGFGNKDPKDFLWTLASVPKAMIVVFLIIKILCN